MGKPFLRCGRREIHWGPCTCAEPAAINRLRRAGRYFPLNGYRSFLQRERRFLAHLGDGGRPSWRPLIGVVLPPLWHQGHKGATYAPDRCAGQLPQDRGRGPQAPVAAPTGSARAPSGGPGWSVQRDGDGRRSGVDRDPGARLDRSLSGHRRGRRQAAGQVLHARRRGGGLRRRNLSSTRSTAGTKPPTRCYTRSTFWNSIGPTASEAAE
jgi:hypothetical protein